MAKKMLDVLGIIFIVVGLMGLLAKGLLGMHLNMAHDVILVVIGVISLLFGTLGSIRSMRVVCWVLGVIYCIFGIAGLFAGPGASTLGSTAANVHLLKIVPHVLELGDIDTTFNLISGILYLIAGFATPTVFISSTAPREEAGVLR